MQWLLFALFALILWHLQEFFPPKTEEDFLLLRGLRPLLKLGRGDKRNEGFFLPIRSCGRGNWCPARGIPFDLRGEQPFIPYYRYAVRPPPNNA